MKPPTARHHSRSSTDNVWDKIGQLKQILSAERRSPIPVCARPSWPRRWRTGSGCAGRLRCPSARRHQRPPRRLDVAFANRGQAGLFGEFAAIGEGRAVADLGEEAGAGPRPDPWHARQQLTERVRQECLLDSAARASRRAQTRPSSPASSAMTRPVRPRQDGDILTAQRRGDRALMVRSMRDWLVARSALSVGKFISRSRTPPWRSGRPPRFPGQGRCWPGRRAGGWPAGLRQRQVDVEPVDYAQRGQQLTRPSIQSVACPGTGS